MIGIPPTGGLAHAAITAVCYEGLSAETREGQKAVLAIIDGTAG